MGDTLEKALTEYAEMFDDTFPTFQLMGSRTNDEILKIINECTEKKKDVYELGYLKEDLIY